MNVKRNHAEKYLYKVLTEQIDGYTRAVEILEPYVPGDSHVAMAQAELIGTISKLKADRRRICG